jgi:DNA-binding transcriptional ArsR family regulator
MVNNRSPSLDDVFRALADPTRRRIVEALGADERTVGELAAPLEMSLPAVSKHLGVLERAGLLHRRRDGRQHHMRFDPVALAPALGWIEEHRRLWEGSIDKLDTILESTSPTPED